MKVTLTAATLMSLAGCVETYGAPGYVPQFTPMEQFPTMQGSQVPIQPIQQATICRPLYGGGFSCM